MKNFALRCSLPASKSILNRALIIQSYFPDLKIVGDSNCDDVVFMKKALSEMDHQQEIDCGEGGTTLRFMTLRASRLKKDIFLRANSRLMARPQQQLVEILEPLGVSVRLEKDGIRIHSTGWTKPLATIQVSSADSSQYASALLLSAWNLDFDLEFQLLGAKVSESYFAMTLAMVENLGMQILKQGDKFIIPAHQEINKSVYLAEPDLSSAFVFAAAGALFGRCEILNFPSKSLQPDQAFVEVFSQMGIHTEYADSSLITISSDNLKSIEFDLSQSPDLFPVLAVLCSFANGVSRLYGAPHLAFKESNRIQKVAELFDLIGIRYEAKSDGMLVYGGPYQINSKTIDYDTGHDHRMVMASALFKKAGHPINILQSESVNKSLPEFFDLFQECP